MNRRIAFTAAALGLALGGGVATASASTADGLAPTTTTSGDYWACVAIDHVEVGACFGELPDLTDYGTLPGIVGGVTDGLPVS